VNNVSLVLSSQTLERAPVNNARLVPSSQTLERAPVNNASPVPSSQTLERAPANNVPRFPTRLHRVLPNQTVYATHLLSSILTGLAFVQWIRFMRITRQHVPIARQMHRRQLAASHRSTASVMLATRGKTGKCAPSVPSGNTRVLRGRPREFYQAMTSAKLKKANDLFTMALCACVWYV